MATSAPSRRRVASASASSAVATSSAPSGPRSLSRPKTPSSLAANSVCADHPPIASRLSLTRASIRRRSGRGIALSVHQRRDRSERAEVVDEQLVLLDGDAVLALDEVDDLHDT